MTDNIYINENFKIIGFTNGSCKLTFDCKTNNDGICELQRYGGRQKYLNNILELKINNKILVYKINKVEFLTSKKYKLYVDDIYFNTDYIPNEFNEYHYDVNYVMHRTRFTMKGHIELSLIE